MKFGYVDGSWKEVEDMAINEDEDIPKMAIILGLENTVKIKLAITLNMVLEGS